MASSGVNSSVISAVPMKEISGGRCAGGMRVPPQRGLYSEFQYQQRAISIRAGRGRRAKPGRDVTIEHGDKSGSSRLILRLVKTACTIRQGNPRISTYRVCEPLPPPLSAPARMRVRRTFERYLLSRCLLGWDQCRRVPIAPAIWLKLNRPSVETALGATSSSCWSSANLSEFQRLQRSSIVEHSLVCEDRQTRADPNGPSSGSSVTAP